jgi:mannose-6-phosphate isomerase-like protein (cupin superfamily)
MIQSFENILNYPPYEVGERRERPWGHYLVTGVGIDIPGQEFCEKEISIKPGQILSLQSHRLRQETWTVMIGCATVILDGERKTLNQGDKMDIPSSAIHAIANLAQVPCIVYEIQQGVCRENDIIRYCNAYDLCATNDLRPVVQNSLKIYNDILRTLKMSR